MVSQKISGSRGILTESDREFLTDTEKRKELSPSARSQRWSDIRDRIRNGLVDFIFLVKELPPEQRHRVFEDERLVDEDNPKWQERVFSYFVAFAYQQLGDVNRLEEATETGLQRAELLDGDVSTVYANIKVRPQYTVEDIRQRFAENGLDAIEFHEINMLWHAGELSVNECEVLKLEKGMPSGPNGEPGSKELIDDIQEQFEPENDED